MENDGQPQETGRQDNTFLKSTMTFGLITGLILVVYTLILYATNNILKPNFALNLINYIILIAGIYLGTRSFRDQFAGGYITYGKALGYGVVMSIFTGVVVGIFTYLLYAVIDPGLMEESIKLIEEEMLNQGMTADQVETISEMQKKIRSPFMMLLGSVLNYALLGLIFSLITSAFLKKQKPIFDQ
jgi:sulfite exporter TauE/SafE